MSYIEEHDKFAAKYCVITVTNCSYWFEFIDSWPWHLHLYIIGKLMLCPLTLARAPILSKSQSKASQHGRNFPNIFERAGLLCIFFAASWCLMLVLQISRGRSDLRHQVTYTTHVCTGLCWAGAD